MKFRIASVLLCVAVIIPNAAWAYPESTRGPQIRCDSCHLSPTGGGVLRNNPDFFHRAATLPAWFHPGGDVRVGLIGASQRARLALMQADFEAGVSHDETFLGKMSGTVTGGTYGSGMESRKHWVRSQWNDAASFRIGRFMPAFGLALEDHSLVTRKGLGFDQGAETYNFENGWQYDRIEIIGALIFGRPDKKFDHSEKGFTIRSSFNWGDVEPISGARPFQMGWSWFYGRASYGFRQALGPFFTASVTPQWSLSIETDLQNHSQKGLGWLHLGRLSFEHLPGLWLYATHEMTWPESRSARSAILAAHAGVRVGGDLLRTLHLELIGEIRQYWPGGLGSVLLVHYAW